MPIIIDRPVDKVVGITTTLVEGGNLEPNKTYYFIMVAYSFRRYSPSTNVLAQLPWHSDVSDEVSFTTTDTHRSVKVNWTNSNGAVVYNIILTDEQGNYVGRNAFESQNEFVAPVGVLDNGDVGYTITQVSTTNQALCARQLVNNLPFNISKDLGDIRVLFEDGDYTFDDVIEALEASPFQDYYFYDGYHFGGRVSFIPLTNAVGSFTVLRKSISLFRGLVQPGNWALNFKFTFGQWISDEQGHSASNQCNFDTQHGRYPFQGSTVSPNLEFFGGSANLIHSRDGRLPEINYVGYYNGGAQCRFSNNMGGFRAVNLGRSSRGIMGVLRDLKITATNNWSGSGLHYRLLVAGTTSTHNWNSAIVNYDRLDARGFIDTTFAGYRPINMRRMGANLTYEPLYVNSFFNPKFTHPSYEGNNKLNLDSIRYNNNTTVDGKTYNNNILHIFHSFRIRVYDEEGNTIENASVKVYNKSDEIQKLYPVIDLENTPDVDNYETELTTDEEGRTGKYYLISYSLMQDPDSTSIYQSIMIDNNPLTILVTVDGYETNRYELELYDAIQIPITMKKQVPLMIGTNGGVMLKLNPENTGEDRDLGVML